MSSDGRTTDLHVCDHLCRLRLACAAVAGSARRLTIVTLSLFAQPGEESLAIATSITGGRWKQQLSRTSHAVWR